MIGPAPSLFTIHGPVGAGTQNDLPVQVSGNGKIEVLEAQSDGHPIRGTEWH